MFLKEREMKVLSAHTRIEIAQLEIGAKKDPHSLFERAAKVAKLAGKDRIYIDGKLVASAAKKAVRATFPCEKFSATCRHGYGPNLVFPKHLNREDVLKALGILATEEGNETEIARDYFDRYSRLRIEGVEVSFESLSTRATYAWE